MTLEETFESTLKAAQNGEEPAWTTIFDEFAPAVHAYMRVRGARDAEDLVGEVFLQIARNIAKFEGSYRAFSLLVFIVAHHRVIDSRRQTRRYRETFDSQPLPDRADPIVDVEADATAAFDTSWIADALSDLTDSQRDVTSNSPAAFLESLAAARPEERDRWGKRHIAISTPSVAKTGTPAGTSVPDVA